MLAAVLFVGTGLLTYQVYYWVARSVPDEFQLAAQLLTGIPFGLACSLRFVRPRRWVPLTVLLGCVTWVAAYRIGLQLAGNPVPFAGMALAGLTGALGVTLSTGVGCRTLYRLPALIGAALAGAITGAPFGMVINHSNQENLILAISFPLWQIAVGSWILHATAPYHRL